jgi:hypothetical protein
MYERNWPLITAIAVGVIVAAAIGWVIGRSSAPKEPGQAGGASAGAIRVVDGVPIGVEHSRAGALAAADNYVAVSSETVLQAPRRYANLVREAFEAPYQGPAIREGQVLRRRSAETIANYQAGGRAMAIVAARRLEGYAGQRARVTTWTAGLSWGPGRTPGQRWFFTDTRLRWTVDRWRVERIEESQRPAPTPGVVRYSTKTALRTEAFEHDLRAMTAPTYGAPS